MGQKGENHNCRVFGSNHHFCEKILESTRISFMKNKKTKVLYLGPNLLSRVAGSKKVMLDLVNYLDQEQFETGVFFTKGDLAEISKIKTHVRVFDFRWISQIKWSNRLSDLSIIYTIFIFNPDIIMIAGRKLGFSLSNKLKIIFSKKKMVFRMGGVISDSEINNRQYIDWLKNRYVNADAIICASEITKEQYISKLNIEPNIISVVYNGIDIHTILDKGNAEVLGIQSSENINVCCYVGALNDRKDPFTLIKAFEIAKQSISNLTMWIVGEGILERELKEYCEARKIIGCVKFWGYQQNPYPYIKNADLFFSASTRDGFGFTLLEAAALHKPLFYAEGSVGMAKLLQKYDIGCSFPSHDSVYLANLVVQFFGHKEEYSFVGYEQLINELSINNFLKGYSSALKDVSKNNRKPM
jgi:glycosyltransferase involved in cell wall biosynthesis